MTGLTDRPQKSLSSQERATVELKRSQQLEQQIDAALDEAICANKQEFPAAWAQVVKLIKRRTPQQIRRMEKAKGLRK